MENGLGVNWEEVHEKHLHTIGNLTLTGYNSELSNRSFKEKQEISGGFLDSPLRLNESLREAERWDETAIVNRAEMLLEKALKIWPYHGVHQERKEEHREGWTLADHHHLTGEMMKLFKQLQQRILSLDPSITEQINRYYIGYKLNTNFVGIAPRTNRLALCLKLPFSDLNDPQAMCRNMTNTANHFGGDVQVDISSIDDLDYIMFLIRQALERQRVDQ